MDHLPGLAFLSDRFGKSGSSMINYSTIIVLSHLIKKIK